MTRIIIVGYMGSGKTTVGKALSKDMGIPFYDLDWYIESRMRKTVAQIFAERGEEGFRKIEYNMLPEDGQDRTSPTEEQDARGDAGFHCRTVGEA